MNRSDLPNLISAARFVLALPFVAAVVGGHYAAALGIFALAGLSDALDGFLARRYHWQSRLGGFLDPAADKFLMVAGYLAVGWAGIAPLWVVAAVLARDLVIVGGALAFRGLIGRFEAQPLATSKVNTVIQILYLLGLLFERWWVLGWGAQLQWMAWLVLFTTVVSGGHYVAVWSRKARRGGDP